MAERIVSFKDLRVYQNAVGAAMEIYDASKAFPAHERYSLTDQVRRSPRSVAANIAESWRKRRYQAAFIAKLSDAETEAAETQVWLEFSERCGYLPVRQRTQLDQSYEVIIAQLIRMVDEADKWLIR